MLAVQKQFARSAVFTQTQQRKTDLLHDSGVFLGFGNGCDFKRFAPRIVPFLARHERFESRRAAGKRWRFEVLPDRAPAFFQAVTQKEHRPCNPITGCIAAKSVRLKTLAFEARNEPAQL